ncbi:cilia- and flagella-associated protein 251-like isoform X1 [Leptopilina boulardi]|uniref:cilia- and flagella-associated protein 251-like isoform X1 n=1 Tax=Leptopilina boulardi TaxID=63433 RepID=UPI0021F584EC|nr:cilia- and flagella-associated protein 251-like isoform X1 [Leptopilina boulardi]
MSRISSDSTDSEFLSNTNLTNFSPFNLKWVFGINSTVPIINLTTKERTLIAYASSHVIILYNYCSREMFTLQGHSNEIRTLSTDFSGKYLLSADFGKDSVVIIWNIEKRIPMCTIFNPHNDAGMTAAKISFDAKYIVTVGNENCQLLKIWTPGKDIADASIELHPTKRDRVKEISFNDNNSDQFILTLEYQVLFVTWDNAMTVAVFKKGKPNFSSGFWIFLGKYHSHYLCIKELLFQPLINASNTPRFFSLGADKNLVEYDLANSGPYPEPGLKIFNSVQIEFNAIPLSIAWYSEIKDMLVVSNSEYKFRIVSSMTKKIYSTFLGPTFGAPVRIIKILSDQIINEKMQSYIIFVTEKEIGLQKLPLDGNPYKQIALIGHHQKIIKICLSNCKKFLFTLGSNDKCVLMWRINLE